jgi:hypothetical protein
LPGPQPRRCKRFGARRFRRTCRAFARLRQTIENLSAKKLISPCPAELSI